MEMYFLAFKLGGWEGGMVSVSCGVVKHNSVLPEIVMLKCKQGSPILIRKKCY